MKIWKVSSAAVVCVMALLACGGDDDGGSNEIPEDYCQVYAQMCPQEPKLDECLADCGNGQDPGSDQCWFPACAAAVGKCDKDEPGDISVLRCGQARGWYDACGRLADDCQYCSDAANEAACNDAVANDDPDACLDLIGTFEALDLGC